MINLAGAMEEGSEKTGVGDHQGFVLKDKVNWNLEAKGSLGLVF